MQKKEFHIPTNVGKLILQYGGIVKFKLLTTDSFVSFCKDRDVGLDRERLFRLERLRLFSPIIRIQASQRFDGQIELPVPESNKLFEDGILLDTAMNNDYNVPKVEDSEYKAYYSIFQIYHAMNLIERLNCIVQLDELLEDEEKFFSKQRKEDVKKIGKLVFELMSKVSYYKETALICQYISDRYGPRAMTDLRRFEGAGGAGFYSNRYGFDYDWFDYVKEWDANSVSGLFGLNEKILKNLYENIALEQAGIDPLEEWYQLVQFVSVQERGRLKGKALLSETLRVGANMLRLFYEDLYGEKLQHANEVGRQILRHIPELDVRKDKLRYLEFMLNQYNLNPRPKVTLIVEGPSDAIVINEIFEKYYQFHCSVVGVEILVLGGIDNATGKKKDSYSPLLSLVDYLHHHQTISYIVLDNENHVSRIVEESKTKKSIFSDGRNLTTPQYVNHWEKSLELDNYSPGEIADGLTAVADNGIVFTDVDVSEAVSKGVSLEKLYEEKTRYGLNKKTLNRIIINGLIENLPVAVLQEKPIFKIIRDVVKLAKINHFPRTHKSWTKNQLSGYLGTIAKK